LSLAASIGFVAFALFDQRFAAKRWLDAARVNPLVLHSPFAGRWFVAAGGPTHNHHTRVSDQYFAYDFLPKEGEAWDQPILAPCDGMVVHVETRQEDAPPNERRRNTKRPFGNYVSIETPRGYVILAHLKQGSIVVRVGDTIRAGTEIGRCGNSGNTTRAHLHLHAQDQPSQSIGVAAGIPVAFVRDNGEATILRYGDVI
jgi:hypothetical protein